MLGNNSHKNNNIFLLKLLKKTFFYLSKKRKKQLILVFLFMIISGLGEVFSLASLIPLLSIVTNPETIWNIPLVKNFSNLIGIVSPNELFIPFILIFTFANVSSTLVRLLGIWFFEKLSAGIGNDLGVKAFSSTLNREYQELLRIDSSKLITANTIHLSQFVACLSSCLKILTALISSSLIIITMLIINPLISSLTLFIFLGIYLIISKRIQKTIHTNSREIAENDAKQIQIIRESIGSIVEVILSQNQNFHVKKFKKIDLDIRNRKCMNRFLTFFPRNTLESITFILLSGISLTFTLNSKDPIYLIKLIGIFALSVQKILPLFQQAYASLTSIRSQAFAVKSFLDLLRQTKENSFKKIPKGLKIFSKNISFKQIRFKYDNDSNLVLDDINLIINKGDKVGIIGSTGSGKTTFINILLGLLKPQSGLLLIDRCNIYESKNINSLNLWRQSIAYVPQKLFLTNSTIAENIAFAEEDNINFQKIYKVARTAQSYEFINSLPKKFNTCIGEDGAFLSQGQKQRIALARALYKEPKILILDEATSSLDEITEKKVISSIHDHYKDLTLIMIAHRLKTLSSCDYIIDLESGRVNRKIYPDQYDEVLFRKQ